LTGRQEGERVYAFQGFALPSSLVRGEISFSPTPPASKSNELVPREQRRADRECHLLQQESIMTIFASSRLAEFYTHEPDSMPVPLEISNEMFT